MMTGREIGDALRKLRTECGYKQTELALAVPGADPVVISRWENGENLRRFIRHAPDLLVLLGPGLWPLVYQAAHWVHRRDDWQWVEPIAKALTELLQENTKRVPGKVPPLTWKFQFPDLEDLSERLGQPRKLSLMDQLHLADFVWATDIMRGWQKGETLTLPVARRRRSARRTEED